MKFLIVNTVYPAALDWLYASHPGLDTATYAEQLATVLHDMPGVAGFYARNLQRLGYAAEVLIANNERAQAAWAREHGLSNPTATRVLQRVAARLAGKTERTPDWARVLQAQVRATRPDVLLNLSADEIKPFVARTLKASVGMLVGETDAALPLAEDYTCYDLLRCSLPSHVEALSARGLDARLYRFGFEPAVLERVGTPARDVAVSWVGSLSRMHSQRTALVEQVAAAIPDVGLDVWAPAIDHVDARSPLRHRYHGPVWGYGNYTALARSRITLNAQIDTAGDEADNIRLFEATGLGAALVTDRKRNLSEMFEPDAEVVTYADAGECVARTRHLLEHPAEADAIAAAGQRRTLARHTYYQRMQELIEMLDTGVARTRLATHAQPVSG